MIQLSAVYLQLGIKILLENAGLSIFPQQKLGVIGPNGSGKTSLFKLILGEYKEDSGNCTVPKEWRISHMAQEVHGSNRTAIEYILDGDKELRDLEKRIDMLTIDAEKNGDALATLYSKMEVIDGYTAKTRAERLLHGLGFKSGDSNKLVNDFSGGWRIRLNLAKALMCPSELLLLDEPTNHLDLDATLWLEQWLKNYDGTLLIISHDRDFLDNIVTGIVNVENHQLISYTGNYSSYELQKAERLAQQQAAFQKQQERISDIENFVRRFKAKASKAKQAQSRVKELERMEKIAPAHIDSPFNFQFYKPERIPQTLITLDKVSIGYGTKENGDEKILVKNIELSILANSRIGLLGHNGAGKSTLIKTLAGDTTLRDGEKVSSVHLKIGYFAQHQLEALDLDASCATHLQRLSPQASEQEIRRYLGGFAFHGDRVFEPITHFSGGEKARLALAIVTWEKPNLLIMDEPTNHLDLEMRHALTMALQEFEGAIILVSHDRHLLRNTVDDFYLVDDGKIKPFDGTLEDYQHWLSAQKASSNTPNKNTIDTTDVEIKRDKKQDRQAAAAIRDKLKPYAQAIKKTEKSMEKYTTELDKIETTLADPSLYETENKELPALLKKQGDLKKLLAETEEEWMIKSEEMEVLSQELTENM